MDSDELRGKIAGWLYESSQSIIHEILNYDHCYDSAGNLINLLAPELEKARKWDDLGYLTPYVEPENYEETKEKARLWNKVKEIVEMGCYCCPFVDRPCPVDKCSLEKVVDALEGEKDAPH